LGADSVEVALDSSATFFSGTTLGFVGVERVGFDLPLEAK